MTRRIAIIPARGGSKRIPDKNIREFCGRPMISYVLDAARESGLFQKIHVSTDSNKISEIVSELGFPVDFMRPSELADDFTPIMPVLKYVLDRLERLDNPFDQVWLLMACAPNISAEMLCNASLLMENVSPSISLVSVSEYPVPIEWAFHRDSSGLLSALQPGKFAVRSQDIQQSFYDTGTFAVWSSLAVKSSVGSICDVQYKGFVLPKGTAIDIDTESDWVAAEAIFKFRKISKGF